MELPEFKLKVDATQSTVTLTYKDQVGNFVLTDGELNGWELDNFITACIKHIADTEDLRNKLSGKD